MSPVAKDEPAGSVWTRPAKPPRAVKGQSFTQDHLAAVAVALADRDGLDALSMRRVAADLGVTAMSLYWYVDTKDQLIELMVDAVCAEHPTPVGETWRERASAIAHAIRARYAGHPWYVHAFARPGSLPGPNQLRMYEVNVAALTGFGLAPQEISVCLGTINHFVAGYVASPMPGVLAPYRATPGAGEYLRAMAESGAYPNLTRFAGLAEELSTDRFDVELGHVLDGLAAHLDG